MSLRRRKKTLTSSHYVFWRTAPEFRTWGLAIQYRKPNWRHK